MRICLISFWKFYTNLDKKRSEALQPYFWRISFSLSTILCLWGLWNLTSRQCPANDLIFYDWRSLQIHIIGTVVFLIMWMIYVIPPLSPLLIPSTSSMIISFFTKFDDSCKPMELDSRSCTPFLFLMSLALNYTRL